MYAEIEVHRSMICAGVRTGAFGRAIESVVRPGDVVLDVGAGSDILIMSAPRAGAARVYAVERTTVAVMAQELAAANGVSDIIQVIHGYRSRWDPAIHRPTGDDDGPAALTRGARVRHGRPRQSQDRPGSADGDMDEMGHRDARRRLGGA